MTLFRPIKRHTNPNTTNPRVMPKNGRILALFDVDGTLTMARKSIEPQMKDRLKKLRQQITIGVVGGSDLVKQKEQLGQDALDHFDYNFAENGLIAYKKGVQINATSILDKLGNEKIKAFVNFVLAYLSRLDIPVKRCTSLLDLD